MALKKTKPATPKRTSKKTTPAKRGWIRGFFAKLFVPIICIVFFLFGAVVTNMDRLPEVGKRSVYLCVEFFPSPVRRMLTPQEGAFTGTTTLEGIITKVYDGDTATLISAEDSKSYKLRFYGIDAPEKAQQDGDNSQKFLNDKIYNKSVTVKVVNVDQYGRGVANIYLDGEWINLTMVEAGWAWHYAQYADKEYDLKAAMADAKYHKRGIWRHSNDVQAPWDWRRKNQK